ncbi:hypothetical protein ACXIVH_25265, partial [Citrobacter amalonaticus]
DRNRSHWSTSKTPSYTKSVSWQHHLHDLILYDNPDTDTLHLTDEQIILAGSRYNRGLIRAKEDIILSIRKLPGSAEREYSEYGRRIIEKKDILQKISQGN